MSNDIKKLNPNALWENFYAINQVPRGSKKEAKIIKYMKAFGESLGLETVVDKIGNVIIKKPATKGMEDRRTVVLQSHLDMVHQKNSDTNFDFDKDAIKMIIDGDWVTADGTTLGADNGIGVSAIMAILQSKDITHPAVEALFTIDEETGMTGAEFLDESVLTGDILLNLDSEDDDELTIGCAGGVNTNVFMDYTSEKVPADYKAFDIVIKGLKGGHSGVDIHLGRGNANKLMTRLLHKMFPKFGMKISYFNGGNLRNAIPREAFATVVVQPAKVDKFLKEFDRRAKDIRAEYKSIEDGMVISVTEAKLPKEMLNTRSQNRILNALYTVPNGVHRMSPDIPDLVETSSSLATVKIKDGKFISESLQRSSIESGKEDILLAVRAAFELAGAKVKNDGSYPGWAPDTDSAILGTMVQQYTDLFDEKPKVAACHAGLECGIIGTHYPKMDMISFGPTIKNPHSPDEKVNIPSVEKFWKFLLNTLKETPRK